MTNKLQFFRSFVAEFGDVKIDGTNGADDTLRVEFNIERDKLPWPNNAELIVTNLSAETRSRLTAAGPEVARIAAGYNSDPSIIFYGLLDLVDHQKDETSGDWYTRLSSSDCGETLKGKRVSASFAKGTTVGAVVKQILKAMGLGEGNLKDFAFDSDMLRTLPSGTALHGNAAEELTYFLRSAGLEFSIQNSKIQFVKIGRGVPNTQGPLLTPDTGLVGSVVVSLEKATDLTRRRTKKSAARSVETIFGDRVDMVKTIEGKCLLNAQLVPGVPFRVESATVNGDFLCCACRHRGDSRGTDWFTEWKGIPLEDV